MPNFQYTVHLDLSKQELQNFRLQNLATPPSLTSSDIGFPYMNTTDGNAYIWDGQNWISITSAYQHPTYPGTQQPAAALTGAAVISAIAIENGHITGVTTRNLTAANIGAAASAHTHNYSDVINVPNQTFLGNNAGSTGAAKALTVAEVLTMLSIAYGTTALLDAGIDTSQRTWTAKMISDFVNSKITGFITSANLTLGTRTSTTMPINNSAGTGVTLPIATTALAGLQSAADKSKLDGIEANANNYVHPTNNPGTHPFATEVTSGVQVLSQMVVNNEGHIVTIKGRNLTAADLAAVMINNTSNTATNQTWSASKIYQELQNAINQAQTGALVYKGNYNPATNTPSITTDTTIKVGYTYVVSTTGTFAGQEVEAGDMIIAKVDNPGATAGNWQIVNKNIPAIVAATTTIAGIIMLATQAEVNAGTNGTKAVTPLTNKTYFDSRVKTFTQLIGNGSSTSFTITHNLNTNKVTVEIYRVSDRALVGMAITAPTVNTVVVSSNIAPANNAYEVQVTKAE